jgi:hypothetical protein
MPWYSTCQKSCNSGQQYLSLETAAPATPMTKLILETNPSLNQNCRSKHSSYGFMPFRQQPSRNI